MFYRSLELSLLYLLTPVKTCAVEESVSNIVLKLCTSLDEKRGKNVRTFVRLERARTVAAVYKTTAFC